MYFQIRNLAILGRARHISVTEAPHNTIFTSQRRRNLPEWQSDLRLSKQAYNEWINEWMNKWGFRPHVCTYRLNLARRTSWEWRDEWDDTALETHDSKFEPCMAVWGQVRYLSVTEAPHNIKSLRMSGEEMCYFET